MGEAALVSTASTDEFVICKSKIARGTYMFFSLSDIDECNTNRDNCQQTCNNTRGSFTCGCGSGYRLNSDGRTCRGR